MADRNRKTENYRYPLRGARFTPAGTLVTEDTKTFEFEFDAGNLELLFIEMDIFTSTRQTQNDKLQLTIPGPADPTVAGSFGGDVNAYLADYFANDLNGQALAAIGFDASFTGSADRGTWKLVVPATADDTLPIVDGTPSTIFPEGNVDFYIEVNATDGTDTFFWGDQNSVNDVLRRFTYHVPAQRDVNASGSDEPVRILDGTDPNAEVVLRLRRLGESNVDRADQLIRSGAGATDAEKLLSTSVGQIVFSRDVVTLGPVRVAGSPSTVGVPVQGTTLGKKGEIWVGNDGGTQKVFVNLDGTPDGWYEATLTLVS